MYCKVCGEALGPPAEVLHDPEGLHEVTQGIEPSGIDNPEDHHIRVNDGPKGPRLFCDNKGQVTTIVEDPPGDPSGTNGGRPPNGQPEQPPGSGEVYDLPEEQTQSDLVEEIVKNPVYGLSDEQMAEVASWVDIYDGNIPPGDLQGVLENLKGISKQKATLMRKKYEAMLNKHLREQNSEEMGPSIGAAAQGIPNRNPTPRRQPSPQPQAQQPPQGGNSGDTESPDEDPKRGSENQTVRGRGGNQSSLRKVRRRRRVKRRNDVLDEATVEAAREAAPIIAQEMTKNLGTYFGLPAKILEAKAERDPDWFLEKLDQTGLDIDDFLEPSDAKQERMESGGGGTQPAPQADAEVDQALDMVGGGQDGPERAEQTDTTNTPEPQSEVEHPMQASPDPIEEDEFLEDEGDEEDAFDQIMGGGAE